MEVACKADKWKKQKEDRSKKKANVKEMAAVVEEPAAAAPQSTPVAALNSVRAVPAVLPP